MNSSQGMSKPEQAVMVALWVALFLVLAACSRGRAEIAPPEIRFGEDMCVQCNMIISDPRFAAGYALELVPGRYESLAFDDIGDMLKHAEQHPEHEVVAWFVHDYASQDWLDATRAYFVTSPQLPTPMGHGLAAHATIEAAQQMAAELGGQVMGWEELRERQAAGTLMFAVHPQVIASSRLTRRRL